MSYSKYAPVKNTCPMFDDIQNAVESALSDIESIVEATEYKYQVSSNVGDIRYQINKELEYIRDANKELRAWGESLVSHIESLEKDHENELRAMQDGIDNLAYKLHEVTLANEDLTCEVNELRNQKYAGTL